MTTKKELIQMFKDNIKWYARPRNYSVFTKDELQKHYDEAVRLGLTI